MSQRRATAGNGAAGRHFQGFVHPNNAKLRASRCQTSATCQTDPVSGLEAIAQFVKYVPWENGDVYLFNLYFGLASDAA